MKESQLFGKIEERNTEKKASQIEEDIFDIIRRRQEKIENELLESEKSWRLSPEDGGDPKIVSDFARNREIKIEEMACERLNAYQEEMEKQGKFAFENEEEYLQMLEEEKHNIKYFPVIFISAPHIESDISGTFGGEPTPLMYATSVMDRHLQIDEFPSFKTPEVKAVLNPDVYNKDFEDSLILLIERHKPKVVGISNISEGHYYAMRITKIIKSISPETIIIIGGSHEDGTNPEIYRKTSKRAKSKEKSKYTGVRLPTEKYELSEEQLKQLEKLRTFGSEEEKELIDFVVSGDAPYLLMEIMKIIADNPKASIDDLKEIIISQKECFSKIEGSGNLFFYDKSKKKIEDIEISGIPLNRNNLPFMFRSRLSRENRYPIFNNKKTAQVMACQGCIQSCDFCFESASPTLYGVPKLQQRKPENVLHELNLIKEQGYQAVFFDDSTFTQNPNITNKFMDLLIERKKESADYLEWGCQTTIKSVDPEKNPGLLKKMAEAGCTYIYFGIEQADPETNHVQKASKLPIYQKNWGQIFEDVCKECHSVGIRVGCSLQFGLGEGQESWQRTINLIKKMYDQGFIAPNSVAININTPYPETEEWIELAKKEGMNLPDYREKLERHPRFETAHQFSSLAWQTADDIYALAKPQLGDALVGVSFSNKEISEKIERYRKTYDRDFYFDEKTYSDYLEGNIEGSHFNSASLSAPFPEVKKTAENIFKRENSLSVEEKQKILDEAREKAAKLINLKDKKGVVFGRNTTEAASIVYWLSGLKKGDNVVLTNGENLSMQRLFELHLDHGNPDREDPWSTWPSWYSKRGKKYKDFLPEKTGVNTVVIEAIGADESKIEEEIKNQINKDTKVFVFSHVLRDNGKELPVSKICDIARKIKAQKNPKDPELFILVDGAQALGNIPKIDFEELGCDAYVATPHKTMKSEVVGILYFNPENPIIKKNINNLNNLYYRDQQVILEGMFDPELGINANVSDSLSYADIVGFSKAVDQMEEIGLNGNNFSEIDNTRKRIKDYFISKIKESGIEIEFPEIENPTNFIISFRIIGRNKKEIAERLSKQGIFLSFINRNPDDPSARYFRISFQPDTTEKDVDKLISSLKSIN